MTDVSSIAYGRGKDRKGTDTNTVWAVDFWDGNLYQLPVGYDWHMADKHDKTIAIKGMYGVTLVNGLYAVGFAAYFAVVIAALF